MEPAKKTYNQLEGEIEELRFQLEEANDTIDAIRTGKVDALIVKDGEGHQLYTLKTADQTYRMFIEKMNEGAVTLTREGFILYCNSRFAEMVGVPLEKVIGLQFKYFISESSIRKVEQLLKDAWNDDCKDEIFLKGGDAADVPCLLSCNTLEMDGKQTLSLILADLSMLKDAEFQLKLKNDQLEAAHSATEKLNDELEATVKDRTKELFLSREHFKLLSDNIPQITWTNLPNGQINFYNNRWFEYTGLKSEDARNWGWNAVLHADDIKETTDKQLAALKAGTIFEVENRYRRFDGVYRWHLNRAIPLRDEAGEIIFWVGTATDIEDQKAAMERKDEFIGIASHELKTPLTSLKGYLQLVLSYKKDPLPGIVVQYIEKANRAITKLQYLVNDLLDVSKIQAGRLEYALANIELSAVIGLCVENAVHIYPQYTFDADVEGNFIVHGNAERLEQVMMNLINNAVKYSQTNKNIIIKAVPHQDNIRVSVTDFGIGLSPDQVEHIFERFYRVEDKKHMASGLGMGLYISAEIIHTHHGKIGVDSELGNGATFYFDLPLISA
jgi:two-component system phosphate regulon sensor histidine kinase PhoR